MNDQEALKLIERQWNECSKLNSSNIVVIARRIVSRRWQKIHCLNRHHASNFENRVAHRSRCRQDQRHEITWILFWELISSLLYSQTLSSFDESSRQCQKERIFHVQEIRQARQRITLSHAKAKKRSIRSEVEVFVVDWQQRSRREFQLSHRTKFEELRDRCWDQSIDVTFQATTRITFECRVLESLRAELHESFDSNDQEKDQCRSSNFECAKLSLSLVDERSNRSHNWHRQASQDFVIDRRKRNHCVLDDRHKDHDRSNSRAQRVDSRRDSKHEQRFERRIFERCWHRDECRSRAILKASNNFECDEREILVLLRNLLEAAHRFSEAHDSRSRLKII